MKAVLQRVLSSSVTVNDQVVSAIGKGVLVLAAIGPHDSKKDVESMAAKVLKMKLWPDESGASWKNSVQDIEGEILCVSQFTLFASTKKGNKPDFHGAAKGEMAKELYDYFVSRVRDQYRAERVKDGVFQAMMQVSLVNDGPVTLEIDTNPVKKESAASTKEPTPISTPAPQNPPIDFIALFIRPQKRVRTSRDPQQGLLNTPILERSIPSTFCIVSDSWSSWFSSLRRMVPLLTKPFVMSTEEKPAHAQSYHILWATDVLVQQPLDVSTT